jgi:hypothetical protein
MIQNLKKKIWQLIRYQTQSEKLLLLLLLFLFFNDIVVIVVQCVLRTHEQVSKESFL